MGTNIYARLHPDYKERKKLALKIKDAILTNEPDVYYQIENILEEYKEKYPVIHLGKRSAGWKFLWAPNPDYYQNNKQSIDLFLHRADVLLYNEYGEILTPQEVWMTMQVVMDSLIMIGIKNILKIIGCMKTVMMLLHQKV